MLYLAVYWDQFPPEGVKIIKYTRAGIKYEQIPTELFVVDIDDIKELDNSGTTILIPYNNESYVYIITEYEHGTESVIKNFLDTLAQKYQIYNYDNTNIILSKQKITNIGIYNFFEDSFHLDGEIIESDELLCDMKEGDFNNQYTLEYLEEK